MNAFRDIRPGRPPLVIAHRGDSYHAPENTLEAARLGHQAGAFAWELDVHLSRDGVPVVLHDESLARTTDVARRFAHDPRAATGFHVADFDWDELRTLDAGSWFLSDRPRSAGAFGTLDRLGSEECAHFASGSVKIPSLVEALELTRDLAWLVNIEMKTFPEADPALLGAVLRAVDRTHMSDRVLISSFDHDDVARAVKARPEIACGALIETPLHRPSAYVRQIVGADFLHASASSLGSESLAYRRFPSAGSLRRIEASPIGVPVLVYTVNDVRPDGLAVHLASLGVAGIFTDDPRGLAALLGRAAG